MLLPCLNVGQEKWNAISRPTCPLHPQIAFNCSELSGSVWKMWKNTFRARIDLSPHMDGAGSSHAAHHHQAVMNWMQWKWMLKRIYVCPFDRGGGGGSNAMPIWRGVRSGVQLSCTGTRFQKCSESGKNGSEHLTLYISICYNVISCKKNPKKHSKNQNRRFYYVNLAPELRNHQKKTLLLIAICSNFLPGESSCPGGSKYVWQRGVEGF